MGEVVVNSRAVARFNFLRFDKFEARNRPHLHILVRYAQAWKNNIIDILMTINHKFWSLRY